MSRTGRSEGQQTVGDRMGCHRSKIFFPRKRQLANTSKSWGDGDTALHQQKRTARDAARLFPAAYESSPDRTPATACCLREELPPPPLEEVLLLTPLSRKERTSAATTGLVSGKLACGVTYCSNMPIGSCDGSDDGTSH